MKALISRLSTSIFETGKYSVIDIYQREELLRELEFSASGCTQEACQLAIGRMLSAEMIVVGNIGKIGSRFHISVKMLETETARTLSATDRLYSNLDMMVDDLPRIAEKLAGPPSVTGRSRTKIKGKAIYGTASLIAGLGFFGTGAYILYDVSTNGKDAIYLAKDAYAAATLPADEEARWNELNETTIEVKKRLYLGMGLAVGGFLLSGLGITLYLIPERPPAVAQSGVPVQPLSFSFNIRY